MAAEDLYDLVEELDRGQFGTVYEARQVYLNRTVALKKIRIRADRDRTEALDEARKLAALPPHDNVVKVTDAGIWDQDHVYIASELHRAGSLERLVDRRPLAATRACELVSELCRGLEHLHHHNLLHLDVRPANVLLDETGAPLLTDFGLARWADRPGVDDWYWPHAAPELVEGGEGEPATDIYATGMTLAHLLTGGAICRPFPTEAAFLQASADGDWPALDELGLTVPQRLKKVIQKATEYDTTKRPSTIGSFKRSLDKATPAISFVGQPGEIWESTAGEWRVEMIEDEGVFDVKVQRRGRRRKDLEAERLTRRQAESHVRGLLGRFAYH